MDPHESISFDGRFKKCAISMASSTPPMVCNFLLLIPWRKEGPLASLVVAPEALTFKSKALKIACEPTGAGTKNGLVASWRKVEDPGDMRTKGAQMCTGVQKNSAGVWICTIVRPSMWDTAAAEPSCDSSVVASAARRGL